MKTPFVNVALAAGVIEDATPISTVLINALDFLLSVSGILAMLVLVASGVLYAVSAGDEGRAAFAKKMAFGAAAGVLVILFGLVIIRQLARFF